jgi:acyl-coenzyme A thioesterase PaaI-like protein
LSAEAPVQVLLQKAFQRHWAKLINLWPPFLGAGIRVKRIAPSWREVDVEMNLHRWNRNYVGTHYGGSLYSMADPFFMLMLIENLGRDYIVWDKSASIRFRRPGKGLVRASFRLSDEQIQEIRDALQTEEKIDRTFLVEVKDESGTVIAEVQKVIHVKRKAMARAEATPVESAAAR